MLANFQYCLGKVLQSEGGYVNDPRDPGGPTNLGVTIWEAKSIGLDVNHDGKTDILDIKALTPSDAGKVFKTFYWDKVGGDSLPSGVDFAVFDFAVNSGVARAAIFLQEIVLAAPDGKIGPMTLAAFGAGWTARVTEVRADSLKLAGATT